MTMLTKNFYRVLLNQMQKPKLTNTVVKYDGTTVTDPNTPSFLLQGLEVVRCAQWLPGMYGTFFGTGTTPPTINDYELESPIVDGTLSSSVRMDPIQAIDDDHARLYITHEVQNKGTSSVTITEAGVFGCMYSSSDTTFLLDRTLLDTPVTIPAGGTKSITYAIVFDYPTA